MSESWSMVEKLAEFNKILEDLKHIEMKHGDEGLKKLVKNTWRRD